MMATDVWKYQRLYLAALEIGFLEHGPAVVLFDLADVTAKLKPGNFMGEEDLSNIQAKFLSFAREMGELCHDAVLKYEAVEQN